MIPKKLSIKGFLSYQNRSTIDFTGIDLACITGSNGAGKSSLLDAMTWGLFGQARKKDDSIINNFSEYAEVEFDFEYEGNDYRILRTKHRDKPTVLEFQILSGGAWKPLTEKSVRDTEDRITSTLNMNYDVFTNASFFLQGKADSFAQQRPGDRKRILGSILGLETWETYKANAVDYRKKVEADLSLLDGRMQEIQAELSEGDQRKQALADLNSQMADIIMARDAQAKLVESLKKDKDKVDEINDAVEVLETSIENLNANLTTVAMKINKVTEEQKSADEILDHSKDVEKLVAELAENQNRLHELDELSGKFGNQQLLRQTIAHDIANARVQLDQEFKSLQPLKTEAIKATEDAVPLEKKLTEEQEIIQSLRGSVQMLEHFQNELSEAVKRESDAKAENPRLRQEMETLKLQIAELEKEDASNCPFCDQIIKPEEKGALLAKLQADGKGMGNRFRENLEYLKMAESKVSEHKNKLKEIESNKELLNKHELVEAQLTSRIQSLRDIQSKWETGYSIRFNELDDTLKNESYGSESKKKLAKLDAEMLATGYDPELHETIRQAVRQSDIVNQKVVELEKTKEVISHLNRELIGLNDQDKALKTTLKQNADSLNEKKAKLAELKTGDQDYKSASAELITIQERENSLRMGIGAAKQKVDVLTTLQERLSAFTKDRENISRTIEQIKILERAFGKNGVPALLIEQALPEIENRANNILTQLSGGDMSVRFVTQKEYKDDKREDLKETLDIQISDPAGTRDYEMFSGGEAFRVNFAVRLALAEVLAQRAGARLQMLVIDEGFGSQDSLGRQRLLEAINLVKSDFAKILVITHIEELKDAFPNQIEVEKTSTGTQLRVK